MNLFKKIFPAEEVRNNIKINTRGMVYSNVIKQIDKYCIWVSVWEQIRLPCKKIIYVDSIIQELHDKI